MILSPRISYKQSSLYQQVHLHRRQRPMRRVAAATAAATTPQGSIKKPSSIQKSIWCTGSEISPLQLGEIFSSSLRKLACYAVRRTSPKCWRWSTSTGAQGSARRRRCGTHFLRQIRPCRGDSCVKIQVKTRQTPARQTNFLLSGEITYSDRHHSIIVAFWSSVLDRT